MSWSPKFTSHAVLRVEIGKGYITSGCPCPPHFIGPKTDHYKTANYGRKSALQSTDLVEGIKTGFGDGVLQKVLGNRYIDLWNETTDYLGW